MKAARQLLLPCASIEVYIWQTMWPNSCDLSTEFSTEFSILYGCYAAKIHTYFY